jgi:hypothetical protein
LRHISDIKDSYSSCDGDHELEQGFHLQLETHGVHDEEGVTYSDSSPGALQVKHSCGEEIDS